MHLLRPPTLAGHNFACSFTFCSRYTNVVAASLLMAVNKSPVHVQSMKFARNSISSCSLECSQDVTVLHSHTVTNFGDLAGAKTSNLLQGRGTRQGMIASPYASHVSRPILGVPYSSLCVCVRKGLGKTVHLYSLCALCKLHS